MTLQVPNDKSTQTTEAKKAEILNKIGDISKAEDRVLFPDSHGMKVKICGDEILLKPLPIKYAKLVASYVQKILSMPGGTPEEQEEWRKNANELIIDSFTDCLVEMCNFYKKPKTKDEIQETMSTTEIKAVIIAQSRLNEDSDFLLQPLHIIIALISKSEEAIERVREVMNTDTLEKTLVSMQGSVKSGDVPTVN